MVKGGTGVSMATKNRCGRPSETGRPCEVVTGSWPVTGRWSTAGGGEPPIVGIAPPSLLVGQGTRGWPQVVRVGISCIEQVDDQCNWPHGGGEWLKP